MTDKKTILILILIASLVAILVGVLIFIYSGPKDTGKANNQIEQNNLYFVTEEVGVGYGISKTDGSVLLKPEYSQLARVDNSVYLKTAEDSYIYFLSDGKSVSLGGKESEVYFVYDKENKLLPYFIFRYGETEQASIFRIFNNKGIRHDTKDFASLNDAYKFLNAKEVFKSTIASTSITDKYAVISTLDYPTIDGKTQYIVSKIDDLSKLKGLVDEDGRVILEPVYTNLTAISGSKNAIKAEKDTKTYIFLSTEKLIEVESGFEFTTSDGYFIQKKGNTVNKIYNLSGEVTIDGIYNLKDDLTPLNLKNGAAYMLVQEKKAVYSLYNVTGNKKVEGEYSNVVLDYITNYSVLAKNTSFIYNSNGKYYAVDVDTLKSYEMTIKSKIFSPLDLGNIYKIM
ncbi:MAG: hypothetical protein K0R72_897 [Clostridia bacterium]|jgi:hypothetical protein|nr:hypothetical protein [Clostridia bacterium]